MRRSRCGPQWHTGTGGWRSAALGLSQHPHSSSCSVAHLAHLQMSAITINGRQLELGGADPAQSLAALCRERAGDQASPCRRLVCPAYPAGPPVWRPDGNEGEQEQHGGAHRRLGPWHQGRSCVPPCWQPCVPATSLVVASGTASVPPARRACAWHAPAAPAGPAQWPLCRLEAQVGLGACQAGHFVAQPVPRRGGYLPCTPHHLHQGFKPAPPSTVTGQLPHTRPAAASQARC